MLMNEDISNIRQSVHMKDLVSMYGYKITRTGFISCPFHKGGDKHPSMKIYDGDRGYYCFTCNSGGDVIDFVRKHDGLGFEGAVRHIADLFGVPLCDGKGDKLSEADRKRLSEQKAKREAAQKAAAERRMKLSRLSDEILWLNQLIAVSEPLGPVWVAAHKRLEACEAQWEDLFDQERQ